MDERLADLPEEFVELVRDALLHLYDPSHLQTHPLLGAMDYPGAVAATRGKRLYQALLGAIEALRPVRGTETQSRAWRAYRILELRYIDAHEAASVMSEVTLSKNQYHRDHGRALLAVASLLWERWHLDGRWPVSAGPRSPSEPGSRDLARIEVEHLLVGGSGQTDQIDSAEVLASVIELLEPLCARRNVDLRAEVAAPLPPVLGSRVALRQVLLTILAQVIGAAAPGLVEVVVTSQTRRVVVRVSAELDSSQVLGRLKLEPCLPFVDALQGSIHEAQSGEDPRCVVEFSFPVPQGSCLLVVDNNPDFIRLVDRFLGGHGWEIIGASDIERASTLVAQVHPRAILLDLVIPGRDGWELLLALKSAPRTRDIPVVVCSVLSEPEVALSLGAIACLQKPVDQKQLLAALGPIASSRPEAA